MERAHIHLPITRSNGDVLLYADVTLLDPVSGQEVYPTAWDGPGEVAQQVSWPITFAPGIVDLWLDQPGRYDLRVVGDNGYASTIQGVDIHPATSHQVRIPNNAQPFTTAPAPNRWVKSTAGALRFVDPGLIPAHDHDGTDANSTSLENIVSNETDSTLGGSVAVTPDHTLLGFGSSASTGATVLGDHNGPGATNGTVLPLDSTGAATGHVDDTGVAMRALEVTGDTLAIDRDLKVDGLRIEGDAVLGGAAGTLGFFGADGVARPARPGGDSGAMTSLLNALQAYGLVGPVAPGYVDLPMWKPLLDGDYPLFRTDPGAYTPTYSGTSRTFEWVGTNPYVDVADEDASMGIMHRIAASGSGYGIGRWLLPWTVPAGKKVTDAQVTVEYMLSYTGTGTPASIERVQPYLKQNPDSASGPWLSQNAGNYFEPPSIGTWNTVTLGGALSTDMGGLAPCIYWTDAAPGAEGSLEELVSILAADTDGNGAMLSMVLGSTAAGTWDLKVSYINLRLFLANA